MVFRLYFAKAFLLLLLTCAVYTHVTKACLNVISHHESEYQRQTESFYCQKSSHMCVYRVYCPSNGATLLSNEAESYLE